MQTRTPHVLVVGGGIGGLCLAHGLRQAGIPTEVAERTRSRTDWVQGYRIHIDPHGGRALHDCLPPTAWAQFCAAASDEQQVFSVRTEQLSRLLVATGEPRADPVDRHHGISRIALREVLLHDLDDVVALDREFQRYEPLPDGRVRAHFADGSTSDADLLIGADGANSRVRGQLLPHVGRLDTGVTAIAGKRPLTGEHGVPAALLAGPTTVLPPRSGGMFTAVWRGDRARVAAVPPDAPRGFLFDTTTDYVFWAYADATSTFPALDDLAGPALTAVVGERIASWSPDLRRLVAGSAPETVNALRVRSAQPVAPWPTGPVTLLGDAIHNMTPMAGIGANTALRDADLLRRLLIAVRDGEMALTAAVADYERQMLEYGFAAVAESLRNARFAASSNGVARRSARSALRVVDRLPPLKRRMMRA